METDTDTMTRPIRTTRTGRVLVAMAALMLPAAGTLTACGSDGDATDDAGATTEAPGAAADTDSDATNELSIDDVWARPGTAGGNSAVYMTITGGGTDDALVGASVAPEVVATVEVHETVEADPDDMGSDDMGSDDMGGSGDMGSDDGEGHGDMGSGSGMKTMREVDSIAVPAGETVTLEPGGYHIMLMDLNKDLEPGDTLEVTLELESGATETVTAEVREP